MRAINKHSTKPFSREDKRVAIELWRAKVPLATIRKQLKMSERSLRRILSFAKSNPDAPVAGRKRDPGSRTSNLKITPALVEDMRKLLSKSPTLSARQLKARVPGLENIAIRTIQDACVKKLAMRSRKMAKKPLLTERMMLQRLEFANQYQHWGVEDWKRVMFSDESHFELQFGTKVDRCRRPKGSDRFSTKFTRKTVKHPPKVMAWACFSWNGRGGLEFLKKGEMMNGVRYRQLLEEKLEFFMHQHQTTHFLQDGAPCHKARIVTNWFNERPHIQLIKWPGNSPDLNPIENVWAWMKVQLRESTATNMKDWTRHITELWTIKMSDIDYLRRLVESMPRRLQEVIQRNGAATKY
jgi:hypothetical protein